MLLVQGFPVDFILAINWGPKVGPNLGEGGLLNPTRFEGFYSPVSVELVNSFDVAGSCSRELTKNSIHMLLHQVTAESAGQFGLIGPAADAHPLRALVCALSSFGLRLADSSSH